MERGKGLKALKVTIVFCLFATLAYSASDFPHFGINNIGCDSCHFVYGSQPSLLPPWTSHVPQDIDDTQYNTLCWSCHNDIDAPFVKTHSSLQIDNSYGDWTVECRVCHNPHFQKQFRTYGNASYLYSGASAGITASALTKTGAAWTVNAYQGYILYPNVSQANYNYEILSNTADTITMQGPINLTKASAGNTFAIVYGNLINDTIDLSRITITPSKSGSKTTRFFRTTGSNSFADGDATYDGVCEVCHTQTNHFRNNGTGPDQLHTNMGSIPGTKCTNCHKHENGFRGMGGGAHTTHVLEGYGPKLACSECHGANIPPVLADGQNLANTTICDNCHSATGAAIAKTYWVNAGSSRGEAGSWAVVTSETSYCSSCHDSNPGNTKKDGTGDTAPNVMENGTTYGYSITGHGKTTGNYTRLSWQSTADTGNPAANRQCSSCHNLTSQHFNNSGKRLKAGYENDNNNSNCKQCHNPGTVATADPQWYTTYADYQSSSHGSKKCSDCHDVHGASGNYPAMTKKNQETLCYDCHKDPSSGGIENIAVSGSSLADDIQQAFGLANIHDLGTSFSISSKNYTLECVSCHNVHIITGKYWDADQDKSPVTRFSNNTAVWGDSSFEKMDYYANPGKYQKPLVTANTYNSAKLPDYTTFCLDCHSNAVDSISAKDWDNDPHGKKTAGLSGMITGGGVTGTGYGGPKDCPDWKGCGRAFDWGSDRCSTSGTNNDCWPVIPRGWGTNAFVIGGYDQKERNAGINYVLSCTDCHEAHGSSNYKMLRKALNRAYDGEDIPLTNDRKVWDDSPADSLGLCMQCHNPKNTREHSYNPGWHNNYTCATGPCHQPENTGHPPFGHDKCYGRCHSSTYVRDTDLLNDPQQWATFHENRRKGNNSQTATAEPGLVFNYRFENNLKDSNAWNLHGISFNGSVSYVSGKVGNAVVLNDRPIEVGTEEHQWGSTTYDSDGPHGNTSKLTEMKYNTTVEAWVYPTSNPSDGYERKIMARHNYWSGGYAFVLKPISSQYRAGFLVNVDLGGPTESWDSVGCNGLRGAYSSVIIPLNEWTHVAATFDTAGPDGTSGDWSVGRIRIYVNGNDVTTGENPAVNTNCWVQPGTGETAITPYTEYMTKWPTCGGGTWCATALSVGGLNWSAPNDNFDGRLDEVKLWYVTQDASYFDPIDAAVAPKILTVTVSTQTALLVSFSEPVYANANATGDLQASDFVLTDIDNGRTITGVTHTAGDTTATLTLSSALDMSNDIGVDTVAAAGNAIYDEQETAMGMSAVTITGSLCPDPASFQLNEGAGSATIQDAEGFITGVVNNAAGTLPGDGYYHGAGTGSGNYIDFENSGNCLQATTAMTFETRVKPAGIPSDGTNYITRILERGGGGNYQISLWRNNNTTEEDPPNNVVMVAFWVKPADTHGGNAWKATLTDFNACPIVDSKWYQIKVGWDSGVVGGIPSSIYIDDQGENGDNVGESWAGYINCTDSDQSQMPSASEVWEGDVISSADGDFLIGANINNYANNLFNGLIDWITWKDSTD
jgi:predicted CXXCH cytochrome family protein